MKTPDIAKQLTRLTRLRASDHRVVTCYLKLEPRDRARGKYLIKLKNRIRVVEEALEQVDLPRGSREEVKADLARILEYLKSPGNLPATQAIAVFASKAIGLFEAVPLPWVHRSRLAVDRTPLVRELASIEDEFGRLLTVVMDRTSARIFEVTAFECHEIEGVRADYTRGKKFRGEKDGWGGRSEHDFHSRIRQEKDRHHAQVAQELFTLNQRQPYIGLILAGTGAEASAMEPFLHPYLAERVMGMAKLNPKDLSVPDVRAATIEVRQQYERQEERSLVEELDNSLGTGWAASGFAETLRALSHGQVRTLLVAADAAERGFRCKDSGRLTLNEVDCQEEGGAMAVLDVVDEAIEEALRQRVGVNVVYDEDAAGKIDGIAGLLRFR
ncbi:MAG: hypothetical protein ABI679_01350 [Gemmatimonadota bacterium]